MNFRVLGSTLFQRCRFVSSCPIVGAVRLRNSLPRPPVPHAERVVATRAVSKAQNRSSRSPSRSKPPSQKAPAPGRSRQPAPQPLQTTDQLASFFSQADFSSLGIHTQVAAALKAAGFKQPSRVQELAAPHVLQGDNVVLAAETGSGKTIAYIAPVATALLHQRSRLAAAAADSADSSSGERLHKDLALVLCANAALCQQVVATTEALCDSDKAPLVRAVQVSSSLPPPFETPDVIVATPGGLMALITGSGRHYGGLWTSEGLARAVKHVIVDEADLLTTGGYAKDLNRILEIFKVRKVSSP